MLDNLCSKKCVGGGRLNTFNAFGHATILYSKVLFGHFEGITFELLLSTSLTIS